MNKKKIFYFSITTLSLGVFTALSVKYFPAVALAIKSGVIASAAPLVAFAVFVTIALASAVALIKFAVPEKERSLVNEKKQAAPTPSLIPHVTEELTGTVLQQHPGNNLTKEMETTQPETDGGVVANSADESLNSLLPEYPSMSPLDTEKQNQLPAPPSIPTIEGLSSIHKRTPSFFHSHLDDDSVQSFMSLPPYLPDQPVTLNNAKLGLRLGVALDERKQQLNQTNSEEEFLRERDQFNGITRMDDDYISWNTSWDSSNFSSIVSTSNEPNSLLPTEQHLDSIVEEVNSGPEERLLNVRLNTNSVAHDNSRSMVNGNSRNN